MKVLKKIGSIILYIIAGLIVVILVIGMFIDPIAKNLLEKQVSNADEGQYSLALDDLDISILGGDVELVGITFETDTVHSETPPIAFLQADKIAVEGLGWLRYLVTSKLDLNTIVLDNIEIQIFAKALEEMQDTTAQQSPFRIQQLDIYPVFKEQVDRVHLKDLRLNEISFTLINVGTQDTLAFDANELNLESDDILIDADKLITDNRAFYATEIDFEAKGLILKRRGEVNIDAEVGEFNFLTDEEILGIEVKELVLLQNNLEQTDSLLFVNFQAFELNGLEMNGIQEDSIANLNRISLSNLSIINKGMMPADTTSGSDTIQNNLPSIGELSLGESLPEFIKQFRLNELDIEEVNIRQGDSINVQNANLQAKQLIIDEQSAFAENRFLHADKMEGHVHLISASLSAAMLNLELEDFAFDFNKGLGRVGFTKLQLNPEQKSQNEMWYEATLGPFEIVNLDVRNLSNNNLSIDSIGLQKPVLLVNLPDESQQTQQKSQNQAAQQPFSPPNLYTAIENVLDQVSLRKFAIIGANVQVDGMGKNGETLKIPAFYLQLRDILIAEGTAFTNNRVLHAKDIAFRTENVFFPVDEVYTLEIDLARFSTFEQFVELRGIRYGYGQNAEAIFEKHGTNQLLNLANPYFKINKLDFQRLIQKQEFFASSAQAEGFELFSYNNENFSEGGTQAEEEAVKEAEKVAATMPQTQIKNIEVPFFMESFDLNSGTITYKQMASEADTAGIMEVTDFFVNVSNITNVANKLSQNPDIKMKTGGLIMGSGPFELEVDLNMVSESKEVDIRGKMDTLNVTELNKFTEYTSRLGFESGEIYAVNWDIDANEEEAEGKLELSYNNLDIRISESNTADTTGILKEVGSFLANNLVLESDVAEKSSEEPEQTEISEERGDNEPFPAYILKAIVWGFVDIMVTIF